MTEREAQTAMQDEASDLAVLHPDVEVEIAGRKVTVREYRFIDGMRARIKAKPLIESLREATVSRRVLDMTLEDYIDMLAEHRALVVELMADSIEGADQDWIEGLSEDDGGLLQLTWWGVCGRFFARLVARKETEAALERFRKAAGSTSSTPSPAPVTEASGNSRPNTRSGS